MTISTQKRQPDKSTPPPRAGQSRLVLSPISRHLRKEITLPMPPDSTPLTQADAETMLMGVQPLDAVLEARSTHNHEVVAAAGGNGLTHKVVQKARKGRQLTARAQKKVLAAVNAAGKLKDFPALKHEEAFNYIGR